MHAPVCAYTHLLLIKQQPTNEWHLCEKPPGNFGIKDKTGATSETMACSICQLGYYCPGSAFDKPINQQPCKSEKETSF